MPCSSRRDVSLGSVQCHPECFLGVPRCYLRLQVHTRRAVHVLAPQLGDQVSRGFGLLASAVGWWRWRLRWRQRSPRGGAHAVNFPKEKPPSLQSVAPARPSAARCSASRDAAHSCASGHVCLHDPGPLPRRVPLSLRHAILPSVRPSASRAPGRAPCSLHDVCVWLLKS